MTKTLVLLALGGLLGCGHHDLHAPDTGRPDGGDGGTRDAGVPCEGGGWGACCYKHSNGATTATVTLRIAGIHLTAPSAPVLFSDVLQGTIDDGSANWLIQLSDAGDDGPMTITTGAGVCEAGLVGCSFTDEPQILSGTITGETWMAGPATGTLRIPALGVLGGAPPVVLPLQSLVIDSATLSEDRSCIGARSGRGWSYGTPESSLTAYIGVDDARAIEAELLGTTLCALIAGMSCDMPQSDWSNKPDAICTHGVCSSGGCDGATTCNAFTVLAQFAAAGVSMSGEMHDPGPYCDGVGWGGCCYLHSNGAVAATPSLRVAGIHWTAPALLANPATGNIVQNTIDWGGFNWLIHLADAGDDGPMTITTGLGECSRLSGCSMTGEPQTLTGTITGDVWRAGPATGTLRIPVFGNSALMTLPLRGLEIESATLSEDRSCIGARLERGWSYGTPESSMTAYITVDDARALDFMLGSGQGSGTANLCAMLAGEYCSTWQGTWPHKPDAICTAGACSSGGCDPSTTCNAFTVHAQFAAAGVSIN